MITRAKPLKVTISKLSLSRVIMSRASADFWGDFRGIFIFGVFGGVLFYGMGLGVVGLYGLGEGSTDLVGIVRTCRG